MPEPNYCVVDEKNALGFGLESESLPYDIRANTLMDLETSFSRQEEQRQTMFKEDAKTREDFVEQVKAYIDDTAEKKRVLFQQLQDHLDRHLEKFMARSIGIRNTLALEYNEAEHVRGTISSASATRVQAIFDDALSLMEQEAACLEKVQSQHSDWCRGEVEALLNAMNTVIVDMQQSFSNHFFDRLRSIGVAVPASPEDMFDSLVVTPTGIPHTYIADTPGQPLVTPETVPVLSPRPRLQSRSRSRPRTRPQSASSDGDIWLQRPVRRRPVSPPNEPFVRYCCNHIQ